jgi:hypothetical protein
MAVNIIEELDKTNQAVRAIRALAMTAIDQAFPDENPPHWSLALDLLARVAEQELESLHDRLTSLFAETNLGVAGLVKGKPEAAAPVGRPGEDLSVAAP